ncbi:unnamed protein product [Linum trigynum]|uniref:Uncharacterized protein n=1 Tax=Linum trigynum TaxID=586398 RepID=A0AAV2DD73_9ROSI
MRKLLHGERSKSKLRCRNHAVKDGFLLLVVNRHFSKCEPISNGDEDHARALGNSGSSLSLSRNCFLSLKLRTLILWLQIGLKTQNFPTHTARPHGRVTSPATRVRCANRSVLISDSSFLHGHDPHGRVEFQDGRVSSLEFPHGPCDFARAIWCHTAV